VQEFGLGNSSSELGPTEEQLLRVSTDRVTSGQTRAVVVTVAGEVDLYTLDQFRGGLAAGFDQLGGGEVLVIDLTEVRFISSTGLQALVDVAEAMQGRREPLRIVVDHARPVIHPLKITGLAEILALFDTVEQALQLPA